MTTTVITIVTAVLYWVFLGLSVFALIDVIRRPEQAFPAVERQTKMAWAIFTGLSAVIILLFGPINFLGIIGVVVTAFYMVDVRPKVRAITGG